MSSTAGLTAEQALHRRRLGRALALVHNTQPLLDQPLVRAALERLLFAGRAMDLAARLHEHDVISGEQAKDYAAFCGIGDDELRTRVLPALERAGVVAYDLEGEELRRVEEFVGVTGSLLDQTALLLEQLNLSDTERATLHSVLVGSWAPLAHSEHLQTLSLRGFADATAEQGLAHSIALGVNHGIDSDELREEVVYNPNVWGSKQIEIARFLKYRQVDEREVLLGILEKASSQPGLALAAFGPPNGDALTAARKVGLLPTASVSSTAAGQSGATYAFAPLIEAEDDLLVTTEALHARKLFVAHMLFAHEKALSTYGRVRSPVVLVQALINCGSVGPASNIGTDYHLLEAAGVVEVDDSGPRPFLKLVKREIAEGGLMWLRQTYGDGGAAAAAGLPGLRPPSTFKPPEIDRAGIRANAAVAEIHRSAILDLRKEAQRAAVGEVTG